MATPLNGGLHSPTNTRSAGHRRAQSSASPLNRVVSPTNGHTHSPPPDSANFSANFETPTSPIARKDHSSLPPLLSGGQPKPNPPSLSPSFASPPSPHPRSPSIGSPSSAMRFTGSSQFSPSSNTSLASNPRRHGRIHSRNLSIFFPRPGAEPVSTIAEDDDGAQELEYPTVGLDPSPLPLSPSPQPQQQLGKGFKFGGVKPPDPSNGISANGSSPSIISPTVSVSKRRGHHHKHSMSHNFFSFMEPGATPNTAQTAEASSPWASVSPFPSTPSLHSIATAVDVSKANRESRDPLPTSYSANAIPSSPTQSVRNLWHDSAHIVAVAFFAFEFVIGALLWAAGQARGTLACTGLGYWIVFDSFGVALSSSIITNSLFQSHEISEKDVLRRPFGPRRGETTALFSQAIYLLFSAVYVLKEAVEHFLLASGDSQSAEAHHHHHGGEDPNGIHFPVVLLWLSLASLIYSNLHYRNHSRLVDATGSLLPDPTTAFSTIPFLRRSARPLLHALQSSRILSNQFTLAPVSFVSLLLYATHFADGSQHLSLDMAVSSLETIWTFAIAYPTGVALGKILLQTAPERNLPSGIMESFLRVMREIERHPQVLHLPAPHLWQVSLPRTHRALSRTSSASASTATSKGLTSSASYRSLSSTNTDPSEMGMELVATIEVHVRKELSDVEVLEMTRWVSEKVEKALGKPRKGSVTIGIVRG